jgi:hypothetical protein
MQHTAVGGGMSRLGADGLLLTRAFLWGVTFDERQTAIGALGCALILVGAVASEIGPLFGRKAASGAT